MERNILVVGSINRDLSFITEKLPRPGETIAAKFHSGHGGKGSNQAVAAGLLTNPGTVIFVSAVGRDSFGDEAESFIKSKGVQCRIMRTPSPTGLASITVDAKGENIIVLALGANMDMTPSVVESALGDDVVPSCVLLQMEIPLETVCSVIKRYAELNKVRKGNEKSFIILNPAPFDPELDFHQIKGCVDCYTPNETEFESTIRKVFGDRHVDIDFSDGESLHKLCGEIGMERVIITLGAKGCFYSHGATGVFKFVEAIKREAIDTTGAGDAFNGALVAYIHKQVLMLCKNGEDTQAVINDTVWLDACAYACKAAGISVTRLGTSGSFPTIDEME